MEQLTTEVALQKIRKEGNSLLRAERTTENPVPFKLEAVRLQVYVMCIEYFTGHPNFLVYDKNYSFRKGLLICGGVGSGKSIMMEAFSRVMMLDKSRPLFEMIDSYTIVRDFQINGFAVIEKYSSNHNWKGHRGSREIPKGLCIDDMGMEDQNAFSFGNKANVIDQILYERHRRIHINGMVTHATTNCEPPKLKSLYGIRTADRMKQMFNIIVLNTKSLRK